MSSRQRKRRKQMRVLLLVLLSAMVTTASAVVYNIMYMEAFGVAVEAPKVYFIVGDDGTAAGATVGTNGTYVKLSSMAGWPNATRIYENATAIKNVDGSARDIVLTFESWSGNTANVTILVKVFNSAGTQQGTTVTISEGNEGSNTGTISIPQDAIFRVQWEIKWDAGALSSYNVSMTLSLRVENE